MCFVHLSKNFSSPETNHKHLGCDQQPEAKSYHALQEIDLIGFLQGDDDKIWIKLLKMAGRLTSGTGRV